MACGLCKLARESATKYAVRRVLLPRRLSQRRRLSASGLIPTFHSRPDEWYIVTEPPVASVNSLNPNSFYIGAAQQRASYLTPSPTLQRREVSLCSGHEMWEIMCI